MIQLKENQGIPRSVLLMMAVIAGLTVANCYYNQPLLELIRHDIGITEQSANLITVITQIGYALGLFFLIPLGDMFSPKKLILANMSIFIPIAGQFSAPKNKSRNMGIVLSGLLTGILTSRVISGYIGEWLGWREMFLVAAFVMLICMGVMLLMMPEMKRNYEGTYRGLMSTMAEIMVLHPSVRLYAIRAAFGFGSIITSVCSERLRKLWPGL